MNEDDTFRRLRRVPFIEMRNTIVRMNNEYNAQNLNNPTQKQIDEMMASYGWTQQEYGVALMQHIANMVKS